MNRIFDTFKKAALFSAAFFIFQRAVAVVSPFENIKIKASELLAQKQKDKAIQLIISFSGTDRAKNYRNETGELLFAVAQSFLSKDAQEEYENSINETLSNEKAALRSAERCLKLDQQNVDCLIQKARILNRQNNDKQFLSVLEEVRALLAKSPYETVIQLVIDKKNPDFKNKTILNQFPTQPTERNVLYLALELDRSFEARNFSRVREVLNYAEKNYQEWPDIAYFKFRLSQESSESGQKTDDDLYSVYINKCKSLSRSSARKFRYDFDMCNRGKKP